MTLLDIIKNVNKYPTDRALKQRSFYYRQIKKGKDVFPLTAFEKNYYLIYKFKKLIKGKSKEFVIDCLKEISKIIIAGNKTPYLKRREKKFKTKKRCFVCKTQKAYYFHHIVLLKNGGFNSRLNRIPICEDCHKQIHEWMHINEKLNNEIYQMDEEFFGITA